MHIRIIVLVSRLDCSVFLGKKVIEMYLKMVELMSIYGFGKFDVGLLRLLYIIWSMYAMY